MALLNPPELRVSVLVIITGYLAACRGQREQQDRLLDVLAPTGLSKDGKHQNDVAVNLSCARELGLVTIEGDDVQLMPEVRKPAGDSAQAMASYIRRSVLAPELNTAEWGSQKGARDLTNALAWFLQFPASAAPTGYEGGKRDAADLQTTDFGRRHAAGRDADDEEGDGAAGWPIANDTRWRTFRRWSCALGFCWLSPSGDLIPDPTRAVRDVLPDVFEGAKVLDGPAFVHALGRCLPVMETGEYRKFVNAHRADPPEGDGRLSFATTEVLKRLGTEGRIRLEDHADTEKLTLSDGTTVSHVSLEAMS
ncbi:protein DpdG [Candidatus Poriferisodalis sp.]|uniref:protein DpdG n=1 Tax=Candidatus Poriferisodalis sp. TaxID=3101277 RepID=UPI003B024056